MPYVVTQSCCADASCVVACPVNCLHPAPGEPGFAEAEMLHVDPDACVDCGACVTACPAGAIVPHIALTEDQQPFLAINRDYYAVHPHSDRTPLALIPARRRLTRPGPFRVAVVGAGPAGMYAADALLRHPEISVDVHDRLPTPYGLVRSGVAPDHLRTRGVADLFQAIEEQPGFRYRLGVQVGPGPDGRPGEVSPEDLARRYDAVVWAVGASGARRLGVPGEDLPGSVSATALTGWANGRPDDQDLPVPLDHERVVVVGAGNVALDVARLLSLDPAELAPTAVARLPETALRRSAVREVVVLARRGPEDVAFTVPELVGLRALAARGGVRLVLDAGGRPVDLTHPKAALLADAAGDGFPWDVDELPLPTGTAPWGVEVSRHPMGNRPVRTIVIRCRTEVVRVVGEGRVEGVEVVRDGVREVIPAGLLVAAVGFRGEPLPGLPYDERTGTVPHERGRVAPGTYVVGWAKRGPRGFIGTNRGCAEETVAALLDDLDAGLPRPEVVPGPLPGEIDLVGWRAIDAEERRRGVVQGRARGTIVDVDELRRVAAAGPTDRPAGRRVPALAARVLGRGRRS